MNRHRAAQLKVIEMTGAKQRIITGPRILPVVQYGRARYFADLQLGQFRDIENPHRFVDFDSEEGRLMCRRIGVAWCGECGMGVSQFMQEIKEKLQEQKGAYGRYLK